jgi:aspartyl-tRNA(Asn)/glutamyl-tRNA(Gln) amidotransferase subunit A
MTDGPLFGTTHNPWNLDHTPGGSSGGAGATMAAGIGTVAFGNDGGGSIRIPSSYSGLYGIKPTTGRVPHHPPTGPGDSLGAGGPLARSTADAATFLNVVARPDRRDWYSLPDDQRDWRAGLGDGVRGLRVAATHTLGGAVARPEIVAAFEHAVAAFEELGAHVEWVGSVFEPLRPRFEAHWKALFGLRLRTVPEDRWGELDPGFLALAREGLDVDLATFAAAQAEQARHGAHLRQFHATYDLLLTPTMPTLPPRADVIYHSSDHDRWTDAVPYTVPFNLSGQPAASVPCAVIDGLPVGLQIVADRYREDLVLRAMQAFESARPFPWPHPALAASLAAMTAA